MQPKTILLLLHLAGLAIGFGSVIALDLHLLRFLRGARVRASDADLVHHLSRLVTIGLALLWASGIGFLLLYWNATPHLLGNGKLHAKIAIVLAITANGFLLHARILPLFARNLGRPLFAGLAPAEQRLAIGCGALSGTGWLAAFLLGTLRELNFAAPAEIFLAAYLAALIPIASIAFALAVRRAHAMPSSPGSAAMSANGSAP